MAMINLRRLTFVSMEPSTDISKQILWLDVTYTNNDRTVIAQYFVDSVWQLGQTARVIRADCRTENGYFAAVQRVIRRHGEDDWAGDDSIIYGKSVSNQPIEAWWSILRKDCTRWVDRFFQTYEEMEIV